MLVQFGNINLCDIFICELLRSDAEQKRYKGGGSILKCQLLFCVCWCKWTQNNAANADSSRYKA